MELLATMLFGALCWEVGKVLGVWTYRRLK